MITPGVLDSSGNRDVEINAVHDPYAHVFVLLRGVLNQYVACLRNRALRERSRRWHTGVRSSLSHTQKRCALPTKKQVNIITDNKIGLTAFNSGVQ